MDFKQLVQIFIDLGLKAIPLLGVVAFLVFVVGVGRFIKSNSESKESDKSMLVWGVVGMFVLFTVWGIVRFIQKEFFPSSSFGIPLIRLNGEWFSDRIVSEEEEAAFFNR